MLEKVIENWTSRLDYIRASRGSRMPEMIFKIRTSSKGIRDAECGGVGAGFESRRRSHCSATLGLLVMDHVILNHGQVTWTTPELAPSSPNYNTTPTGGRFSSRQI
ncbi:hypothetical protein TNCV_2920741 [Trichonephila clavipes]|nr:hypothetical protein TNCV_2920741 [Trichonephila clavipes]